MAYHYETNDAYDLDWSNEVMDKLSYKFEDEDIITHYDIESHTDGERAYGPTYRVYYIEFSTSNYDYELKLDDEYRHWILSKDGNYIAEFYSGLDFDDDTYTVDIDIKELNDWIIEEVTKFEEKELVNERKKEYKYKVNKLIEELNDDDDITFEDEVKLVKYFMDKLDISITNIENLD